MRNTIRTAFGLALAIGLALSSLAVASADTTTRPMDFSTQMTPSFPVTDYAGAYVGALHLSIAANGIVSGWYRAQDAGPVQSVVGGRDGDKIWFDISNRANLPSDNERVRSDSPLQVTGTLRNGRIEGSAQNGSSWLAFTAQLQPSSEQTQ